MAGHPGHPLHSAASPEKPGYFAKFAWVAPQTCLSFVNWHDRCLVSVQSHHSITALKEMAGVNQLNAYINRVNAFVNSRRLTLEDADPLRAANRFGINMSKASELKR